MSDRKPEQQSQESRGGKLVDGAIRVVQDNLSKLDEAQLKLAAKLISNTKTARALALVGLLLSSGCSNVEKPTVTPTHPSPSPRPSPTREITPTPVPIATPRPPEPAPPPLESGVDIDGVVILTDKNGVPFKYRLPNGQEFPLDQEKMKKIRQQAIDQKEGQIAEIITLPDTSKIDTTPRQDHPVKKELPKDVLTPEQLKQHGITIIQSDNTELSIRQSAFAKGGILEDYQEDAKNKMTIAILNSPVVTDAAMTDPKYHWIRNVYLHKGSLIERPEKKVDVEAYRQQQLQAIDQEIAHARQDPKLRDSITLLKIEKYETERLTPEQLRFELLNRNNPEAGVWTTATDEQGDTQSVVILALGETLASPKQIILAFEADGYLAPISSTIAERRFIAPAANQSFPNPNDFERHAEASPDNPWTYPYGGQTAGQTLRHELEHDNLIKGPSRHIDINDPKMKMPNGQLNIDAYINASQGNESEYDTDEAAMQTIRQAWEKWKNSGYKDDSGYPFVFKLRNGEGYILTEEKQSQENQLI